MSFNQTTDGYASVATLGYGSSLLVGDGASPEVFTKVAYISKITPGAITTGVVDRTHLQSPEAHREKMPGIRDAGPFQLEGQFIPTNTTQSNQATSPAAGGLVYLARNRSIRNWQIQLNDAAYTVWPFQGFISSFQIGEISLEAPLTFTAEVTPTQDYTAALP